MRDAIKTAYIAQLQWVYPTQYAPGSLRLELAERAADAALAGRLVLRGECWEWAVREVTGGFSRDLVANLKGLPE